MDKPKLFIKIDYRFTPEKANSLHKMMYMHSKISKKETLFKQ